MFLTLSSLTPVHRCTIGRENSPVRPKEEAAVAFAKQAIEPRFLDLRHQCW